MGYYNNELYHYGVKGMKWGIRRFQKERYSQNDVAISGGGGGILIEEDEEKKKREELLKLGKSFAKLAFEYFRGITFGGMKNNPYNKTIYEQGKELVTKELSGRNSFRRRSGG